MEASIRVRRAIHLNDLVLLKRIIKNNPRMLQNSDFEENGNTSLHLAAQLGSIEISEFLIEAGHEADGISRNGDFDTPLHIAVESSEAVAKLLAQRFPRCIAFRNKTGADPIMLLSRTPNASLLPTLISLYPVPQHLLNLRPPIPLQAVDMDGNTALHYASAYGQLKCIRALLEAGADPGKRNGWNWTAVSYSLSVQAEVYFRGLVGEAGVRSTRIDSLQGATGVKLLQGDDDINRGVGGGLRGRAGS